MGLLKRAGQSATLASLGAHLIALYLRFVGLTSRYVVMNEEALSAPARRGEPLIAAFWHGRMMGTQRIFRGYRGATVLVSDHRDGQFIAGVVQALGFSTVRGSTARQKPGAAKAKDKGGAAGLRAMIRRLKDGHYVGITPDGPRGPRMRLSPGTLTLAALSEVPLVCIGFSATAAIVIGSWDRLVLPLPFGTLIAEISAPMHIPRDLDEEAIEALRLQVEQTLIEVTQACDRRAGRIPIAPEPCTSMQADEMESVP